MQRQDVAYWLALKQIPRLSSEKKLALVAAIGIKKLFDAPPALSSFNLSQKQIDAIVKPDWQKITQILIACQHCQCQAIGYEDGQYPPLLKELYDPPLVLFVQGDLALLSSPQIAIVGSRGATITGRELTQVFAYQLSEQGLTITSGLAIGIDGNAHQAALKADGKTIAVVATGLDTVYPSRHRSLVQKILAQGGAIVSEFPPGTLAKPGHFPRRNRIISGLSLAVLVVEAEMQSGSLITARTALEQNREVFAMPGNVANPMSKGCHWLIKQGAKLVDEIADIMSELDFSPISGQLSQSLIKNDEKNLQNNVEQGLLIDPLLASVGYEATPVDKVVSRSKLPVEEVVSRLTVLELRGLVSAVPGGYQRLIKG